MDRAGATAKGSIRFELLTADLATTADVVDAQRHVIRAMAAGEVPVLEGDRMIIALDRFKASLEDELAKQRNAAHNAQIAEWRAAKAAREAEEEAEEAEREAAELEATAASDRALAEDLALFGVGEGEKNREIQAEAPAAPEPEAISETAPPPADPPRYDVSDQLRTSGCARPGTNGCGDLADWHPS